MSDLLNGLDQVVPAILQVVGTVLGIVALNLVTKVKGLVIEKTSKETYDRAVEVAKGLYVLLEDEFKEVEKAGKEKAEQMRDRLLQLFPSLTDDELDAINKIVWESFNQAYTNPGIELALGELETLDEYDAEDLGGDTEGGNVENLDEAAGKAEEVAEPKGESPGKK